MVEADPDIHHQFEHIQDQILKFLFQEIHSLWYIMIINIPVIGFP